MCICTIVSNSIACSHFIHTTKLCTRQMTTVPLSHAANYVGKVVNDGECASGVQQVFHDHYGKWVLNLTKTWKAGAKVFGNKSVKPGTAIASFSGGKYTGKGCHTAIFVSQSATGIKVYDQWKGKADKWSTRELTKVARNPNSNQADRFFVLLHG